MKYPGTVDSDYEKVDNTPVEMPTRLRLPQTRTDQIRAFIRQELSMVAQDQGHETFEEADDLEPDDEDSTPFTRYEELELEPPARPEKTPPSLQTGSAPSGAAPADPAPPSEVPPSRTPGGGDGPKTP